MITIKSPREVDVMARAGAILADTLQLVADHVRPGVSTGELDDLAEKFIRSHPGATPSFKGLYDFPKSLCTSVSDEIVHGIPAHDRVLVEGELLSVDCGVCLEGLHADSAVTVAVGSVSSEAHRLLAVTQDALEAGIVAAQVGQYTGDIGHAVQAVVEAAGFSIIRELVGHGIGTQFHEEPQVPNYGKPHRGRKLVEGMTLAIEPMVSVGGPEIRTLDDRWTVVTADGTLSAHFEHTVLVHRDGPRILTRAVAGTPV